MKISAAPLPIDAALPDLLAALHASGRAVLQAPPGAGKTTRVPLALLDAVPGKILILEPRRLAARSAAAQMARTLGEDLGQTVGFRMRGDTQVGPTTRIEVLTEGVFTRMVQTDPDLPGVSAVIFDEFHERSLTADLGLALTWEVRSALRDDLWVLVMSATLDAGPVAALLDDAPVITSQGRSFPVDIRHLPKPRRAKAGRFQFEDDMADLIIQALGEEDGGLLAFLPGEAEINRVADRLAPRVPTGCVIRPLLAALPFKDQQRAVAPERDPGLRKVVLATAIAETSLTIEDIRIVVDGGKARRARFDPARGLSALVTDPVSRAEATQRTGRAGRVAPGVGYRLWSKAEEGALPAFAPPEITIADLSDLALNLAAWGTGPDELALLTQPPKGPWAAAQDLLAGLGAVADGRITKHGQRLAQIPAHPRLAQMLVRGGPAGVPVAAILNSGVRLARDAADLTGVLKDNRLPKQAIQTVRAEEKRLRRFADTSRDFSAAQALALGYPDRIAMVRPGDGTSFLLSSGSGAVMDAANPLAGQRFVVVADLGKGRGPDPIIRHALPISEAALRDAFPDQITRSQRCTWSKRHNRVDAQDGTFLFALPLQKQRWTDAPAEAVAAAMLDGVRDVGLALPPAARRLQARVALARDAAPDLPDMSDDALMDSLDDWLLPFVQGVTTAAAWKAFDPLPALQARLGWDGQQRLNAILPPKFTTPLGRDIAIDYSGDTPAISVRLQEMFGQTTHPQVVGKPLQIILLSPAHKTIQVTMDLPGFWTGSYADVRKDMRAQYPKHPWPEDPTQADPTLRAKPRKR